MRKDFLRAVSEDLPTIVHSPEEYKARKQAVLAKIDPQKEFVQGGEISACFSKM